jgi:hypothetical protein
MWPFAGYATLMLNFHVCAQLSNFFTWQKTLKNERLTCRIIRDERHWDLEQLASDTSKDCLCSHISGSLQATCVSPVLTVSVCYNICLQARIAADLIELRNKSVFAFFMFNALFVLIVFLLQLNKDMLHVDWPLGVKTNITYIEETAEVKTRQWVTTCVQPSTNGYRLFWSGF